MTILKTFILSLVLMASFSAGLYANNSPSDSLDATRYEIRIHEINFAAHTLNASTTVWLTPLDNAVPEISLELIELTVTAAWVDGSPVAGFTQGDSLVTLPLDAPLEPGDTAIVRIDYNGVPFHESWGGFHFSGEYAFNLGVGISTIPHNLGKSWYPCVDNFTDRATYDVYCTLPEGKMAVGGGILVEKIDNGNGTFTWHWNLAQEVPTYLSSIAIGNYACVSDTFNSLSGPVPIDIYVRPQDTNKVEGTFIHLKDILAIYEECMGPYSWGRVGYTGTAIGAMEHATNIFVPHTTITGNTSNEELMAHELTHMWLGDKVTCCSPYEMWINEGWATFFGMYYALALYGNENNYKQAMRNKHASVLQTCHTPSGDGSYFPLNQIPQEYTYGMSAYDRASTVCQAMRFYLGDSLFFGALKGFIDEFAFQPVSSYDMRDFMTGYTGTDMNGFFDNFILNAGTPHYSIDSFAVGQNNNGLYDVTVYARQKRKGPAFTGNGNRMEVLFMDGSWNRYPDTISFDGETGSWVSMVPFIPSVMLADPEERMCDATTDNYKTIKATGNYTFEKTFFSLDVLNVPDSAFIQATHNWVPPDSLDEAVPGLRISDYRYWRIDGILPDGFDATGKFYYSTNGYLDNTLITSSSDTIIILYRKNAGEDWQEIDFEKIGPWNIGNILVHHLQLGDYALAVKESTLGTTGEALPVKSLEVFPNPSEGRFNIRLSASTGGELRIMNSGGHVVHMLTSYTGRDIFIWEATGFACGTYLLAYYPYDNSEPEIRKLVYLQ